MAQSGISNIALSKLAVLGLGGLACFFVAKAAMVWLNPTSEWKAPRVIAASQSGSAQSGQGSSSFDYAFDPFHPDAVAEEFIEPEDVGEDAPDTTLNLTLKGFISPNRAIIEGLDRKQTSYGVGDEVTRNVTIGSIYPASEYVILLRNGAKERLSIERNSEMMTDTNMPASGRMPVKSAGNGALDPAAMLDSLSFNPVTKDNRTIGYRIASSKGMDIRKLGFRSGDVLTKIGKTNLTQPGIDLKKTIMEAVLSGNTTAQIMRRGRKMTIRVKLP